jgi:hypothetical protein
VQLGIAFLRDELLRREVEASSARMERMTKQILWLTIAIAVLTLVNTGAVILALRH